MVAMRKLDGEQVLMRIFIGESDRWEHRPLLCVNTGATLTPALSLAEGEGAVSIPSPPEGERVRVRGRAGRATHIRE